MCDSTRDADSAKLVCCWLPRLIACPPQYLPSTVAASAVCVALRSAGRPWTAALGHHTGHTEASLRPCVADMLAILRHAGSGKSSLRAVVKKFATAKREAASTVQAPAVAWA